MRGHVVAALALIAGCGFNVPNASHDAGGSDARAPTDNGCVSATDVFDTCALGSGSDLEIASDATYDTDTGVLRAGGVLIATLDTHVTTPTGMIDVLIVHELDLEATLTATGTQPLAIYASASATLGGTLTVANGGAGARTSCANGPGVGADSSDGAGGGGGGAFGGNGGAGGEGDSNGTHGGNGGTHETLPAGLVGGCPGASGGEDGAGSGGSGGGAVLIATPGTIELRASGGIDAGGGGGAAGTKTNNGGGGGGGGAGGLVILEASTISIASTGYLVANGGGGGEGGANGTDGNPGEPGHRDTTAAGGGFGVNHAGNGGNGGAASTTSDGSPAPSGADDGGGGGGGGAGYIAVKGSLAGSGTFSPAPTTWP
ncbi:MAG TPA: hypothetical protein VGG74_35310 [Kofleriaceae bacterium]|jgi:hypothetical protein